MRLRSRSGILIGLSALGFGLVNCGETAETNLTSLELNEVDQVASGLGGLVAGCSTAGGTAYDATTKQMTVTYTGETVVISAPGGVLKMNGLTCTTTSLPGGKNLMVTGTTNFVKKIIVNATGGSGVLNGLMLDLYAGPLTTVFAGAVDTGLEVNFAGTDTGTFFLRGTNVADKVNLTSDSALYFDLGLTTDGKADVKVVNADAVRISFAVGNDVFATVTSGISYAGVKLAAMTVPAVPLIIYGGDGDDTITDGDGDDTIFGGQGNDTIKASNNGFDTFYGGTNVSGTENDMIDYGARDVSADVSINLANQGTLVFGAVAVNGDTVTVGVRVYTFAATPTPPLIVGTGSLAVHSRDNLVFAINADPLSQVTAAAGVVPNSIVVTAKASGVAAAAIGTTTTVGGASWGLGSLTRASGLVSGKTHTLYEIENATGGAGNDTIIGSEGPNLIYGGTGNDSIRGGLGVDTIYGGAGNDTIYGGSGDYNDLPNPSDTAADKLFGDLGDDIFWADATGPDGTDTINGGGGTDTVDYSRRVTSVIATVGTSSGNDDNITAVEVLKGGGGGDTLAFAATITGPLTIIGGNGTNSLSGSAAGSNTITGGNGNDTINGGGLADVIYGGTGNDIIDGKAGNDYIEGGPGNDTITCGAGDDLVYAEAGNDVVYGDAGNDTISGGDDNDVLYGGIGDDQITGGLGDDQLCGDAGGDLLNGNAGTNHFIGGNMGAGDICITLNGTTDLVDANTCEVF